MILRNVVRAVVVVVDEELMIFVAYSEDVRIRWCDDKLVALSDSLVMHSSILGHIPDTSGVVSVAKEMLPLEIVWFAYSATMAIKLSQQTTSVMLELTSLNAFGIT